VVGNQRSCAFRQMSLHGEQEFVVCLICYLALIGMSLRHIINA
jgi:hypothetical protein